MLSVGRELMGIDMRAILGKAWYLYPALPIVSNVRRTKSTQRQVLALHLLAISTSCNL